MEKRIRERAENATINREVNALRRACRPSMPAFRMFSARDEFCRETGEMEPWWREMCSENRSPKKPERDALLEATQEPNSAEP